MYSIHPQYQLLKNALPLRERVCNHPVVPLWNPFAGATRAGEALRYFSNRRGGTRHVRHHPRGAQAKPRFVCRPEPSGSPRGPQSHFAYCANHHECRLLQWG